MSNDELRERARLQLGCVVCAGSGAMMISWVASAPCDTCKGSGVRPDIGLSEIVAFHLSELRRGQQGPSADKESLEALAEDGLLATWDKDFKFSFSQVVRLMAEFAIEAPKHFPSPAADVVDVRELIWQAVDVCLAVADGENGGAQRDYARLGHPTLLDANGWVCEQGDDIIKSIREYVAEQFGYPANRVADYDNLEKLANVLRKALDGK